MHTPKLANPLEIKRRMALTKKTDKLDARGLAILLRNGTLPEVWIPPSELRDQRELLRLRIFLVRLRTRLKKILDGLFKRLNSPELGGHIQPTPFARTLGAALTERDSLAHKRTPRLVRSTNRRLSGFRDNLPSRNELSDTWRRAPVCSNIGRSNRNRLSRKFHCPY